MKTETLVSHPRTGREAPFVLKRRPDSPEQLALFDDQDRLQTTFGADLNIDKCISLVRRTYAGWLNVEDFELSQSSAAASQCPNEARTDGHGWCNRCYMTLADRQALLRHGCLVLACPLADDAPPRTVAVHRNHQQ